MVGERELPGHRDQAEGRRGRQQHQLGPGAAQRIAISDGAPQRPGQVRRHRPGVQCPKQPGRLRDDAPQSVRRRLRAQPVKRRPRHRGRQRPRQPLIPAAVQDLRDWDDSTEPGEQLSLPGEAPPVPAPRHPQVAGLQPPHVVVVAGDEPGAADRERQRRRQQFQAVRGGRGPVRVKRVDGDNVPVERAKPVTAGRHDEKAKPIGSAGGYGCTADGRSRRVTAGSPAGLPAVRCPGTVRVSWRRPGVRRVARQASWCWR